jgi:hypothetical protein
MHTSSSASRVGLYSSRYSVSSREICVLRSCASISLTLLRSSLCSSPSARSASIERSLASSNKTWRVETFSLSRSSHRRSLLKISRSSLCFESSEDVVDVVVRRFTGALSKQTECRSLATDETISEMKLFEFLLQIQGSTVELLPRCDEVAPVEPKELEEER